MPLLPPWRSYGSVKVRYLDGPVVIQQMRRISEDLVARDARVEQVILFGSLAKGNYWPRSDADICIILRGDDPRRSIDRIPEFREAFRGAPVPVDVLVCTRAEMDQMRDEGRRFAAEVLSRGIVLATGFVSSATS